MTPTMPVRQAVILAAGLGTRMLPATKAVPKEMLPVADRPVIQYAVEEAVAAGAEHVVIVLAPDRAAIREHFGGGSRIEAVARERGDAALAERVLAPERLARFTFVEQREPLGTGHAVQQARPTSRTSPSPCSSPTTSSSAGSRAPRGSRAPARPAGAAAVIAVQHVAREQIPQYGIVDPEDAGDPVRLRGIVEKPAASDAPSSLGVVGRYVLAPSIFDRIAKLEPGAGGELQFTDALAGQIAAGEAVYACRFEGRRYDAGRPAGAIAAAVAAALDREDLRADLRAHLAALTATEQQPCAS